MNIYEYILAGLLVFSLLAVIITFIWFVYETIIKELIEERKNKKSDTQVSRLIAEKEKLRQLYEMYKESSKNWGNKHQEAVETIQILEDDISFWYSEVDRLREEKQYFKQNAATLSENNEHLQAMVRALNNQDFYDKYIDERNKANKLQYTVNELEKQNKQLRDDKYKYIELYKQKLDENEQLKEQCHNWYNKYNLEKELNERLKNKRDYWEKKHDELFEQNNKLKAENNFLSKL